MKYVRSNSWVIASAFVVGLVGCESIDLDSKEAIVKNYESCIQVISNTTSYSAKFLSGDGDAIKEDGYRSYLIFGQNRDQFFCEVYPSGKYKVKAALGGKYPFKYISNGKITNK